MAKKASEVKSAAAKKSCSKATSKNTAKPEKVSKKTAKVTEKAGAKVSGKSAAGKVSSKEVSAKKVSAGKTAAKVAAGTKKSVVAPAPEITIDTRKIKPHSVEKQTSSPVKMTSEKPDNVGVPASIRSKRRLVVSYQNMNEELAEAFHTKYPRGYADYMGDLFKVDKPDGTSFYAISMETSDSVYLIKMVVRIDKIEDAQAGLFPDVDGGDDGASDGETFPDSPEGSMPDQIADTEDDVD